MSVPGIRSNTEALSSRFLQSRPQHGLCPEWPAGWSSWSSYCGSGLVPMFSGRRRSSLQGPTLPARGPEPQTMPSPGCKRFRLLTSTAREKPEFGIGVYWGNLSYRPQRTEPTAQNDAQNSVVDFRYKDSSISFQPPLKSEFGVWRGVGAGFTHLVF